MGSVCHEIDLVQWSSRDPCLLEGGQAAQGNLCIMLYVKCMWCSSLPSIYGQLEEGAGSVCHENYLV